MKTLIRSSLTFILLIFSISAFSQKKEGSAVICGRIIFEGDSVFPLKPNTIILQKEWPITFQQFEQQEIDTSDYSFKIWIDLNQITYGKFNVNFFHDIDSTAIARNGQWITGEAPDGFFGSEYAGTLKLLVLRILLIAHLS